MIQTLRRQSLYSMGCSNFLQEGYDAADALAKCLEDKGISNEEEINIVHYREQWVQLLRSDVPKDLRENCKLSELENA